MRHGLLILLAWGGLGNAQAMPEAVQRKVARLELARSIRAFAAGTLANSNCLVQDGSVSRHQADAAMTLALREMGIDSNILRNPQVLKAAALLKPALDADCGLSGLSPRQAKRLVQDEL